MPRRYDDEDDWDDLEEFEEEEREPGILTTTRILVGLLVVVVVAIVVARLVFWENPEYSEVSPRLFGLWTTSHPEVNDQYIEFRSNTVTFGTGGTGVVKYKVYGMDVDEVGDLTKYTIFYRDLAGTDHTVDVVLDAPGQELWFTDSADARWTRFEMQGGAQ
jgi:hypothetical protein